MSDKEKLEQILDIVLDEEQFRYFANSKSGATNAIDWVLDTLDYSDVLENMNTIDIVEYLGYNSNLLIFASEKELKEEFPDRFENIIEYGGSLYRKECLELIEKLASRHGWDYVYKKLEE